MKSSKVLSVCFLSEFIRVERSSIIKCSNCGAKLVEGAKFCDICGQPCASPEQQAFIRKKEQAKKRRLIIAGCVVLLVIGGILGVHGFFESKYNRIVSEVTLKDVKETVTAEEYEKIRLGMTLEDVEKIIGGKGKVTYESDYRIEYSWPGEYYDDALLYEFSLEAEFEKDTNTLCSTTENDIVFGESANEYWNLIKHQELSKLDAPTVTMQQLKRLEEGMSPDKVASILGGNGVKSGESTTSRIDSGSKNSEVTTSVYTSYTWKCISSMDDSILPVNLSFFNDKLSGLPDNNLYSIIK